VTPHGVAHRSASHRPGGPVSESEAGPGFQGRLGGAWTATVGRERDRKDSSAIAIKPQQPVVAQIRSNAAHSQSLGFFLAFSFPWHEPFIERVAPIV
jgi:hypothetical protein